MSGPRCAAWAPMVSLQICLCLVATASSHSTLLDQQNEKMFREMQTQRHLSDEQMTKIRLIFARSGFIGQGNPAISQHPQSELQCSNAMKARGVEYAKTQFERICGGKFLAPLYNAQTSDAAHATSCIDQFEFPNIPCTYPVVWVKAKEAAELCEAEGERLCDAHEWEGACAGSLEPPDYPFASVRGIPPSAAITLMRSAHNAAEERRKSWSYGPDYQPGICATGSFKTAGCPGGGWNLCGSNTYPSGSFPDCKSPLEVYDLNGNAAEHMNLPLTPEQMSSRGSRELGYTEMKGSWFMFDTYRAHPDWCRWRAPYWHGSRVMDPSSHANYHLGFRCCKSVAPASP